MAVATVDFASWIDQADIPPSRRTPTLDALLQAVFRFRQQQGGDYYSTRLLSHFLLNCDCGLKVAQVAPLPGIARPTASRQQRLSSKDVIQQAHHRLDGRPHGKLLPRYAGPIAAYLLGHPGSTRAELIDFIQRTFGVRVSRIALYNFLKKYGLDDVPAPPAPAPPGRLAPDPSPPPPAEPASATPPGALAAPGPPPPPAAVLEVAAGLGHGGPQAPPFSSGGRTTPAPSCRVARPSAGWR